MGQPDDLNQSAFHLYGGATRERDAQPLCSKMVNNSGPVGCRLFLGPLIHSPYHTSSIVYEPDLELPLRGNPISAAFVEDDPRHRKE